jgi:hypothetical protein
VRLETQAGRGGRAGEIGAPLPFFSRLTAVLALCAITTACAPREWLLPKLGMTLPRLHDFPADYTPPVSHQTGRPMPGFGGGGGGVTRTPVIFVHGNTVSARFWLPAREYFLKAGYTPDELWALGYGWDNVRYFDSNDLSVVSLERIVNSVTAYLSEKSGRPIEQVDIIAHSLGVTLVRQWMLQTNNFHRVRNFIGVAGANQGVWTAWPDTRGQQRAVSWELYRGSPWLEQLNRPGETPGPVRYMTLYDGTGWGDVLFPKPSHHSSALEGAYNLAFNVEHGTWFDHLMLAREPPTMDAMIAFLRQAPEPLPQAQPPVLVREDDLLRADPPGAFVRCRDDGRYPDNATPPLGAVRLQGRGVYTCFAHDPRSHLSSPMARYRAREEYTPAAELAVSADPAGGVFEHAQFVRLESSDADAFIVYNTAGTPVNTGSPLYLGPIYVPGPLTLSAAAVTPAGHMSPALRVEFDISLEKVEAMHTLQRQFDPEVPVQYEGRRRVGR